MALEFNDGKITGSSGIAKAGLTLGIIGTSLAGLMATNNGNGLFGLGGGNNNTEKMANLQSTIDQLQAERYADGRYLDLYTKLVASSEMSDAKLAALGTGLAQAVAEIDKQTALNEQAQRLNREYDNATRDYMFTIINNKIDCCCDKINMKADYEKQISELSDAAILSYVNSNFIAGTLKLAASNISPNVQLA